MTTTVQTGIAMSFGCLQQCLLALDVAVETVIGGSHTLVPIGFSYWDFDKRTHSLSLKRRLTRGVVAVHIAPGAWYWAN